MIAYYFTTAQYAISNIAFRRVKVSRFMDLNDPFELLGADLGDPQHRQAFRNTKTTLNRDRGLICFTRAWSNPVVWGHYAEKHKGIALGIDVQDDMLEPVHYRRTPFQVKLDISGPKPKIHPSLVQEMLRTKFADWKYEDELRVFVSLDHETVESGNHFVSFGPTFALRKVILGPQCQLPIGDVRRLVKAYSPTVSVMKARIAFRSFRVVTDQVQARAERLARVEVTPVLVPIRA
jgi:hypothetical protein